ncbi:MAG: hypothetical protein JF612_14530 [Planctomycetia bacterium]|nr:hypothetical protein [Planctomycetia bacterium]
MFETEKRRVIAKSLAALAIFWTVCYSNASAQTYTPLNYIDPGTSVQVRTSETVDAQAVDGRIYTGVVDQDVRDAQGRMAIPRGATTELIVRRGSDNELYLDLDSVTVNGQRYAVDATRHPVSTSGIDIKNSGIGNNDETLKHVGGGALWGTVIGAIAGGGKGAAIGAAVGAGAGAATQIYTHGRRVDVPAETLLTYRLQSGLDLGVKDTGYDRSGHHYHHYDGETAR